MAAAAPSGDSEDVIIIEDEDDDVVVIDDDDDVIIIDDGEDVAPEPARRVSGPLGYLWESLHLAITFGASARAQQARDALHYRSINGAWLESWVLPARNLSFSLNAFGRVASAADLQAPGWTVYGDVYEATAKVSLPVGAVQIGRLVVPWGRTRLLAFGDRLNPSDFRQGPSYLDTAWGKQPQLGATFRTSLGSVGLEGAWLATFEPSEGPLTADRIGGRRLGQYHVALARDAASAGGLLDFSERALLGGTGEFARSSVLGVKARQRFGDVDIGASVVWGYDPTPRLGFSPATGGAIAAESLELAFGSGPIVSPCASASSLRGSAACLGQDAFQFDRAVTAAFDATLGLGLVILKSEVLLQPAANGWGGKNTWLLSRDGLYSARLDQFSGVMAIEGALGQWLSGSVELFDVMWTGVPAGSYVYAVEPFAYAADDERTVHRFGLALGLEGAGERLAWRMRGEGGFFQGDVMVNLDVRYRVPFLELPLGVKGSVYGGPEGSPGWFSERASYVGLYLGEGV